MRWIVVALVIAMGARAFGGAWPEFGVRKPLLLTLEGHFAADRAQARSAGADAVGFDVDGSLRWLATTRARTFGDQTLDGRDVIATLAPLQSTVRVVGPANLRHELATAPLDTPLRVEGLVDRTHGTYLLRTVAVGTNQP